MAPLRNWGTVSMIRATPTNGAPAFENSMRPSNTSTIGLVPRWSSAWRAIMFAVSSLTATSGKLTALRWMAPSGTSSCGMIAMANRTTSSCDMAYPLAKVWLLGIICPGPPPHSQRCPTLHQAYPSWVTMGRERRVRLQALCSRRRARRAHHLRTHRKVSRVSWSQRPEKAGRRR